MQSMNQAATGARVLLAAMAVAGACGPPGAPAKPAAGADGAGASGVAAGDLQLTLYRDGALVQDRRTITLEAGQTEVMLGGIARDILPGTLRLVDVTGSGEPVRATGYDLVENGVAAPLGQQITLRRSGELDVTGELLSIDPRGWVLGTGDATRPYLVVNPASVVTVRGAFEDVVGGSAVRWKLAPATAGPRRLETSYVARGFHWDASYTLALDAAGKQAALTGALAVQNDTGALFDGAQVTLIDGDMPGPAGAGAEVGASSSGDDGAELFGMRPVVVPAPTPAPPPAGKKTARGPRRVVLPSLLSIRDSGQQIFNLVGELGKRIPAETTMVFDPVGKKLDAPGRTPVSQKAYGDSVGTEIYRSIELDLERSGLGAEASSQLPRGRVRLFQREGGGALLPLGEAEMFSESVQADGEEGDDPEVSEGDGDPAFARLLAKVDSMLPGALEALPASATPAEQREPDPATKAKAKAKAKAAPNSGAAVRISVGRVPEVRGRRRQSDFDYDPVAKRLVEEISVTLQNDGELPVRVTVREHLYRGQNWTLAYHSALSAAVKEGAQQFRLPVVVPPGGTERVVYRVVYTW